MKSIILFVLASLAVASLCWADPVELSYDGGGRAGHFEQTGVGDIEGVRFTPAHPCSLLSFRFWATARGRMEWHVWGDNGGNMPDVAHNLIDPIVVDVANQNVWVVVNLADRGLHFDIPQHFHIGYVKLAADPDLWVDGGNNVEDRSFIKIGANWYVTAPGSGNYLLRATVEYYDERNSFTFVDVTREAGIRQFSKVAWGDYDNDGWEDLLLDGRTLYRNRGDGAFDNVSERAGIVAGNPSSGGCWGDFDNDGFLDFYGTTSDLNADDRLYHNSGDGTFTFANDDYQIYNGRDPTEASGWGDADNDGSLELYIANSEVWIDDQHQEYYPDFLWTYSPDFGQFFEITPVTGIQRLRYYGRGVAWCDFDGDGDMDIYISNYRLHPNFLLVNQGDVTFRNEARVRGVEGQGRQGYYGHTIGSSWGDYDNDGDFDLFVGNLAHPRFLAFSDKSMLYRNSGDPDYNFSDARDSAGIAYDETASSPAWGDYDNDGWLDLFVTSVYEGRQPFLYHNDGDGHFTNVNYPAGFHQKCYNSWGVAWCDYDHDGDLDLAVGGNHGGLFLNMPEEDHAWLEIALRGTTANSFGFGSKVRISEHGQERQMRQVEGGMGTGGCQNMMAVHFGLGPRHRTLVEIEIEWLGGEVERYRSIGVDHRYLAVQGEGLLAVRGGADRDLQPREFELAAVYPNPFNAQVTVTFRLAKAGLVKIEAIDGSGRRVGMLTRERFEAGLHTLTWDAASLPAGVYILQATTPGVVVSRTIALLK